MSIRTICALLLTSSVSTVYATWRDINMTVYAGKLCQDVNGVSYHSIPTVTTCTQLIPGNFQFYASFVLDVTGNSNGSIHYYDDLHCSETNRIYKFDGAYLQYFNASGDPRCVNCLVADCSIRYAEVEVPADVAIFTKVGITDYPATQCPINVVATSATVPTDGTCVPYMGNKSAMFVRESTADSTGDVMVFVDDACRLLDEGISNDLKDVNVGLDATFECRNKANGVESLGITPFN